MAPGSRGSGETLTCLAGGRGDGNKGARERRAKGLLMGTAVGRVAGMAVWGPWKQGFL